MSLIEEIR